MAPENPDPLLQTVGRRLRRLRQECDLTQRELAARAGLSSRFLAQVEAGRGNIALTRLATLARGLGTSLEELVRDLPQAGTDCGVIALLGLRGAGKSTLGGELARRLGVPFVEQDGLVEEAAGMARGEVIALHGEDYYRRLARRTLDRFLADGEASLVLATTGNVVGDPESLEFLERHARTIWLKASGEDHWQRVLAMGDVRPMNDRPDARAELDRLLARREPLYAKARHTVDTSVLGMDASLERLVELIAEPA
jgi:XRE family aerobic/anaerobic benzoate catabolism transcriptional regulator